MHFSLFHIWFYIFKFIFDFFFFLFPLFGRSGIHSFFFIISILFHCIFSFWSSWLYNVFLYHCWKQDTTYFPYPLYFAIIPPILSSWLPQNTFTLPSIFPPSKWDLWNFYSKSSLPPSFHSQLHYFAVR